MAEDSKHATVQIYIVKWRWLRVCCTTALHPLPRLSLKSRTRNALCLSTERKNL
jgi:hypothetical protein